jgi:predicted esterase
MTVKTCHFKTQKTARYISIGNKEKATVFVFALHGYGQLATFFSKNFEGLDAKYYIIVPEGLHRFYNSGSSGRVGASWMTKEDRLIDIDDNINFLNDLFIRENSQAFEDRILLGFSQGAATAFRWKMNNPELFNSFISWGSSIPDDFDLNNSNPFFSQKNYFIIGNNDPLFSDSAKDEMLNNYKKIGFSTINYDGVHKINTEVLKKVFNRIK